jgi:hypothetical protein
VSALALGGGSRQAFDAPVGGRDRSKPSAQMATPVGAFALNTIQLCAWIAQARPGESLEYHRGLLALDASDETGQFKAAARRELNRVARRAWWAAEHGLVHLVQRRNGPADFSYLAVARLHADQIPQPLSSVLLKEVAP